MSQLVLLLNEGAAETRTPFVRGGKGASLVEMYQLGLSVPPAFTISTSAARAYQQEGVLPKRITWQLNRALTSIEQQSGRTLGSSINPLLLSVRSGAAVSMPGMMDTILNVGLNDETVEAFAKEFGERFAFDSYRRLLSMFGQSVAGIDKELFADALVATKNINGVEQDCELTPVALRALCQVYKEIIAESGDEFPQDVLEQLTRSIFAVFQSWGSERAVAYRQSQNIPHWWGTAVTVQCMVFGNRSENSGTGVVFSSNPLTGASGMYGEFLPNAQGEDVVAGIRTPLKIEDLRGWNASMYDELECAVRKLEAHFHDMVDVEYTVEHGKLFILQCRSAKRTAQAAATYAVQGVWGNLWDRKQALARVTAEQIFQLTKPVFNPDAIAGAKLLASGLPASPGAVSGRAVFTSAEAVSAAERGESVILVRPDTSPDDLPGMLAAKAVVTVDGGTTSHAAVVARGLNIPAVVGCADLEIDGDMALGNNEGVAEGDIISVDGATGKVFLGQLALVEVVHTREVKRFLCWYRRFAANRLPEPEINFAAINSSLSVNQALNDFYIVDAMAQAIKGELSVSVNQLRHKIHINLAEVFACYLVVAVVSELEYTTSETNDNYGKSRLTSQQTSDWEDLQRDFQVGHQSSAEILKILQGGTAAQRLEFFRKAQSVFHQGWDSGFGGPKWAAIAAAPLEFLSGRLNHTAFVDHVFDLKHNGGRVFDKHMMIRGDQYTLHQQLEIKKNTSGVRSLRAKLLSQANQISPEVEELYQQGELRGLW